MDTKVEHLESVIRLLQSEVTRLRGIEAELAGLVASSNDAFVGIAPDGRITRWKGAAQAMFGYTAEEAIGHDLRMLATAIEPVGASAGAPALDSTAPGTDTVWLKRGGEPVDVCVTTSALRDADGHVLGTTAIVRDDSHLRSAQAAVRASDEHLRFALAAAHIGDWHLDLATGQMQHSARHDRCFGYANLQKDWSFDKFIEHVHPEDRAEVEQTLHVAISESRDWRVQCRVVWPDQSVHWISTHGSVQRNAGKATHVRGIVSEITEQRQAENVRLIAQRLEAENRQIQEANRLKSQFLANMSHELRTPLNAVIGFADLLHTGVIEPDSPKHQEFLGHIATSGRHLLQLINDVLDLSKVESGKFEFFPESLDLTDVLKEVQDILQTAITRKNIHVATEVDPAVNHLTLDPARLKQVLYNYLSNAIKFTAVGGHVTMRALAEGPEHFRVEVEDTGIGIAASDLPRLFTEFQQLDAGYSKQHQGTGLGLALTRRLVLAQGGSTGVRSTVGEGSVFHVVLNRHHDTDTRRADGVARDVRTREADRVQLIEHDQRDQAQMIDALAEAGFAVDAVVGGPYALRRARESAYAALMPAAPTPGLRCTESTSGIRIPSAHPAAQIVEPGVAAHPMAHATFDIANVLSKPVRSDEIQTAMGRFASAPGNVTTVMVIDDDQVSLDLMRATLKPFGIDAACFLDGRVALQQMDRLRPVAIILDLMMPAFDGFQVLDALAHLPAGRTVPVFIWTSMLLTDEEYATLARSARAILIKSGGGMQGMLESVRRWRQPSTPSAEQARP